MAHHHNLPDEGAGVLSLVITAILSIWASVAMEVVHGIITIFFALASCVCVFFVQRWLKKKFK